MNKLIMSSVLSMGLIVGSAVPAEAAYSRHHHRSSTVKHRRHMKTVKRVGIGTGAGAAIGALAGGGKGAGIGALAGAGAGALYDHHKKAKTGY